MTVHLCQCNAFQTLFPFDVHNGMAQLQRNIIIIQTLYDISLQSSGIRHQLCNNLNLCAFKCHSSRHDQSDVAGTKDHDLPPRHIAFDIDQSLCRTCRENTCRTIARNIKCTSGTLTASHCQNNCLCLNLEKTFLPVHCGDNLLWADIHNHCIQLVFNIQFFRLINKTSCIFRSGQFFLKCMESESVVDTLIQDSAKFFVSFQDQNTVHSAFLRRNCSRKSCRSSSNDNNIISSHDAMPPSYNESLLVPVIILESPPDFVISNILTWRSLARISIVLGEQNPA